MKSILLRGIQKFPKLRIFELLKWAEDVKPPPSPHITHMQKSTVRPLTAHVKTLSISLGH